MSRKFLTAALFSVLALTLASVAHADDEWQDHANGMNHEAMHDGAVMHQFLQHRLDKLAARLEIKSSQQQAWEGYVHAVLGLADGMDKKDAKPDANEDAATLAHRHADRVAERAKKLAAIADATDKLQAALNGDQRKILAGEMRHHHGRHFGAMGHGDGCGHHGRDMRD